MKFTELGRTGEKVPVMGIGTWKLGYDKPKEILSIRKGISLGMKFIDTAEMYNTESIVADALHGEEGVFLATKVSPNHFRYDDVIKACNNSLKALKVKSVDLYQLHWPNSDVPIEETMKAMEKLVSEGKIRHIGVSNFSVDEMVAAQEALKSERIVSNQVEYSVFVRYVEDTVLPYCNKEKISVIAYSPLSRGAGFQSAGELVTALKEIGEKHVSTPEQIALSWLVSKGNVIAIPKAASPDHMEQNAAAADIKLSKAEIERINGIKDDGTKPLSSRINKFTKKTASFWASLMEKRERLRVRHGI